MTKSSGCLPHSGRSIKTTSRDYSGTPLGKKLGAKPGAEVVVLFTTSHTELALRFPKLKRTLAPRDALWVSWPKKASKIETDLDFDTVQRVGLDAGLVDNKSAAIDEHWQALRFVYRLADRG
ncbi:MAG: DUF3052 domain-containing protein [Gaiellaceae bacterium]